jgi:serine/threonine protein kinase
MNGVRDFYKEALRMRHFFHPRVLRLLGISIDAQYSPLIITPYMKNGDLLTYLKKLKQSSNVSVFLYIFSIRFYLF